MTDPALGQTRPSDVIPPYFVIPDLIRDPASPLPFPSSKACPELVEAAEKPLPITA
jgi:hypothetical protein